MTDLAKPKSQRTQLVLTLLLGPLGLFYSSIPGGALLLLAAPVLYHDFGRAGIGFVWLASIAAGAFCVRRRNRSTAAGMHHEPPRTSSASGV
jgi:hypothetical protein